MQETWRDIVGYEGRYKVSNLGNVKSVVFSHKGKEKILSLLNGKDYLLVRLYKNGSCSMHRVHRLVAEAFIDNPNNYPVVNHKNWDKHDNRVENLEWCTYSFNNWYTFGASRDNYNERLKQKSRSNNSKDFLKSKRVVCVETGTIYESINSAARDTHVEQSNISRVLCGKQRTSGGYHWKYVDEEDKCVGTLEVASGNITEWVPLEKTTDGIVFESDIYDLSDIRKLKGRIRFEVRDFGGKKEIRIVSAQ